MQCKVEDCDRASQTKLGYCIKHYKRFKRNGTTETKLRTYNPGFACEHCGKKYDRFRKGLCHSCSIRLYRKGYIDRDVAPAGSGTINTAGYRVVTVNGEREYEHRIIAKARLGEIVHHKNENKGDNNPDNLQKFKSQAEHMKEHARMRKEKGDE